jgi:hypothetical protein
MLHPGDFPFDSNGKLFQIPTKTYFNRLWQMSLPPPPFSTPSLLSASGSFVKGDSSECEGGVYTCSYVVTAAGAAAANNIYT